MARQCSSWHCQTAPMSPCRWSAVKSSEAKHNPNLAKRAPKPTAEASAAGDAPGPSKAPEKKPAANTAAGQIAGIMAGRPSSWKICCSHGRTPGAKQLCALSSSGKPGQAMPCKASSNYSCWEKYWYFCRHLQDVAQQALKPFRGNSADRHDAGFTPWTVLSEGMRCQSCTRTWRPRCCNNVLWATTFSYPLCYGGCQATDAASFDLS